MGSQKVHALSVSGQELKGADLPKRKSAESPVDILDFD